MTETLVDLEMAKGEAKWIRFTITDSTGSPVNVSGEDISFVVKETYDDTNYLLVKRSISGEFDMSLASTGVIRTNILATESFELDPGEYLAELRVILEADQNVDKRRNMRLKIRDSLFND